MFPQIEWSTGYFSRFQLLSHDIVCWRVVLDTVSNEALDTLFKLLDDKEKSRAGAYIKIADRQRYIAAHGVLRLLLNNILGKDTYSITTNEYGKPEVSNAQVEFNLSHSGNVILLSFSTKTPIGVDVEEIRAIDDIQSIVTHHFDPSEALEILGCLPEDINQTFFSSWTKKESVCKALGLGLNLPLDSFRVSCLPLIGSWSLGAPEGLAQELTLVSFSPLAGYFAAIAAPQQNPTIQFFDFDFSLLQSGHDLAGK
jgi:4'-phosphopantetheinyl transferase